jgi:PEP-CTERM motif
MNMRWNGVLAITAAVCAMIGATAATAATYTETLSVNPSSLVCQTVGAQLTCLGTETFSDSTGSGPFTLVAGQSALVNVDYTSKLTVPRSMVESIALVGLFDATDASTAAPYTEDSGGSTLVGYSSPDSEALSDGLNVISPNGTYTNVIGFLAPSFGAPTAGFSFNSIDSTFAMSNPAGHLLDPNEITGAVFGYQYVLALPEPATWTMMLLGVGAIGGALRINRRKGAAILAAG